MAEVIKIGLKSNKTRRNIRDQDKSGLDSASDLTQDPAAGSMPDAPVFTVAELLAMPHFHEARLLAGKSGLKKSVSRVNVMEVPDILNWVRPGELLMTTGYPFRDKPDLFRQLIPELVERGVSALGIKTKRFLDRIPEEAAQAAERCGLPLIELPPDTVFSDVLREVMERVLVHESTHLVILQNRIQTMSRLLLEGGGMNALLDMLERMLGNPVAVIRPGEPSRFSAALRGRSGPDEAHIEHLLSYASIGSTQGRGFRYADSSKNENEQVNGPVKLQPIKMYVAEIPMPRKRSALLVLLERGRDITPVDALTIDRMCPLAGLELMNAEAVRDVEGKYIEQFTEDWLAGKLLTSDDVMMRACVCGCKIIPDIPLLAAVVAWDGVPKPVGHLRQMAGAIRSGRFNRREFVLAAVHEGELIIIFQANPKADSAFVCELRAICGPSLQSLYIGRSGAGPEHVSISFVEAKRTRQAAEICRLTNELVHYDELGIYSMLYLIPRGEEWEAVLQRFIDPLLASDRKGGRMIETLQAFFRCNGNMRLTSETLFTHYNTIVYRLEKAKQLLGVDLDDPEVRLQLQLALKMHQMRNVP